MGLFFKQALVNVLPSNSSRLSSLRPVCEPNFKSVVGKLASGRHGSDRLLHTEVGVHLSV